MAAVTDEYRKLVLEDIETYDGLNQPLHASFIERLITKKADINKLHPNPSDEFSMPEIGPNYGIVGNYEKTFRENMKHLLEPMEEALVIEKMSTGGYMLLNGHHRWMAAHRIALEKVPVELVNVTPEDELIKKIKASDKEICVSIDLDEVLMKDEPMRFPFSLYYKKSLRKNAGVLINELHQMGIDVWVYTGNYYSDSYINGLFRINRSKVDGIVNNVRNKKSNPRLKDAFREKYNYSLHIDNESIICVNLKQGDYDIIDIVPSDSNWAAEAMSAIRNMDFIKK